MEIPCTRTLDKSNRVALVRKRPRVGHTGAIDMQELKRLRRGQALIDVHRISAYATPTRVRIDRRHFALEDTTVTVARNATTPTGGRAALRQP